MHRILLWHIVVQATEKALLVNMEQASYGLTSNWTTDLVTE